MALKTVDVDFEDGIGDAFDVLLHRHRFLQVLRMHLLVVATNRVGLLNGVAIITRSRTCMSDISELD